MFVVTGLADFAAKISDSLERLVATPKMKRKYCLRNHLRKDMVTGNDILSEFVSGCKNGKSTSFSVLCGNVMFQ